jgi:hypothetical protein
MSCGDKFWFDSPKNLLCTYEVIPDKDMSSSEQYNAITRMFILVMIILYIFDIKHAFLILCLGLITIVITYKLTNKENFLYTKEMIRYNESMLSQSGETDKHSQRTNLPKNPYNSYGPNSAKITYDTLNKLYPLKTEPNAKTYCDDETPIKCLENVNSITANQKLAGCANPKTNIAPVITPPAYAFEYWNSSSMNVPSQINDSTNTDVYRSGYFSSYPTDTTECSIQRPSSVLARNGRNPYAVDVEIQKVDNRYAVPVESKNIGRSNQTEGHTNQNIPQNNIKESYIGPTTQQYDPIDTLCGYNGDNVNYNLPVNSRSGNCQMNDQMNDYNKNLYTQTIQPGVYTRSQVNEPINSNIGISFTQEFEPTVKTLQTNGDVEYVQYNPDGFGNKYKSIQSNFQDTRGNTYDPRFTGYGSTDRSYIESVTEQPRFYYDDVNSVNRPNYMSRSNVDFIPSLPYSYDAPCDTRKLVEQTWTDSSIGFRNDLQEQMMRKMNIGKWQQRIAPIRTCSQRMLGSSRIC